MGIGDLYPLAWHSSLVPCKRFFELFPFYTIPFAFVLAGLENERWAAQALNASKPPLAINNSGPCTPQQLEQSCRETASRVEFGCFNCNHEATRVLSRLGLSTWRRWLLLSLVVSMVPFGYQVQVRLLGFFVGAPVPCRPKPLKQCPAVLQRFKVYEWLVFKKLKICSSKPW